MSKHQFCKVVTMEDFMNEIVTSTGLNEHHNSL